MAGVFFAESDVVHASASPQGDLAVGVDLVVADAEVAAAVVVGGGFGAGDPEHQLTTRENSPVA